MVENLLHTQDTLLQETHDDLLEQINQMNEKIDSISKGGLVLSLGMSKAGAKMPMKSSTRILK